jgi:ribonuclease Z
MKPTFIHRLVNGPYEDPALFVRILREKKAFLFDAGNINNLHPGDLQKITDVFITHTHIDHFIGFDTLLRALLHRDIPLRVYGPADIAGCVEGKLRGYTWNLIREYPLSIEVFSIEGGLVRQSSFHAKTSFRRIDYAPSGFDGILVSNPLFTVSAVELDHQVPCLGFALEEEFHININKSALAAKGLPVGPWLSQLKTAIREAKSGDTVLAVNGREHLLEELSHIAMITKGHKISYVTDAALSEENIRRIILLVRDSDTFYCEAYFLDKDVERARERFHLTAGAAGRIARESGVKDLVVMHFSPRYRKQNESPAEEASAEFRKGSA